MPINGGRFDRRALVMERLARSGSRAWGEGQAEGRFGQAVDGGWILPDPCSLLGGQ